MDDESLEPDMKYFELFQKYYGHNPDKLILRYKTQEICDGYRIFLG